MRRITLLPLSLALLGCAPTAPPADSEPPAQSAAQENAIDLTGHYRIERLADGTQLQFPLDVSADEDSIWWEPACSGQGLAYRTVGKSVEFYDARKGGEYAVCDIGFPPELTQLWRELEGRKTIERTQPRVLRMADGDRQWVFRTTTDPLPPDLTGTWRIEEMNGGGSQELLAIQLEGDAKRLWWNPRCAGQAVSYKMDGGDISVAESGMRAPEDAAEPLPEGAIRGACAIGLPGQLDEVLKTIAQATSAKRDHANNIVLAGPDGYVRLGAVR